MKTFFPSRVISETSASAKTRKAAVFSALSRVIICLVLCLFVRTVSAQEKTKWFPVGFHEEIKNRIEAELKVPVEYLAISLDEYRSNPVFLYDVYKDTSMNPISESEKDEFLISLPYIWDYAVIISRKDENDWLDPNMNLEEKKYITISGNITSEKYLMSKKQKLSYNITTDTNPFNSFSKIFKEEADFTILPSRVAEMLLQITSMKNELAVSGTPDNTILKFSYRFAIKKSDMDSFIKLNDTISKMYKNGPLI